MSLDILSHQFFQNALWASALSALVCGIVGAYIVVRRIVFVSGGITHASFGGLGLGVYLGIDPILSAGLVAVGASLGISRLSRDGYVREDSAIAAVWALGMALGVLFITLTPGYATGLSSYLFGNILLVTQSDLLMLGLCAGVLVLILSRWYRPILYSMFDADFAETRGMKARWWNTAMLVIISVSLVLSIRLVGIMLLMSLLTLPQSIVGLFTANFKRLILGSVLVSLVANILGLMLSYAFAVPSGVLIILVLFVMLMVARTIRWLSMRSAPSTPAS